jgi:hypothetical protein
MCSVSHVLSFLSGQATVNTIVDVQTYIDQYKPDASVLLLRHPAHNLKSISTKFYRDIAGSPGQKFIGEEITMQIYFKVKN